MHHIYTYIIYTYHVNPCNIYIYTHAIYIHTMYIYIHIYIHMYTWYIMLYSVYMYINMYCIYHMVFSTCCIYIYVCMYIYMHLQFEWFETWTCSNIFDYCGTHLSLSILVGHPRLSSISPSPFKRPLAEAFFSPSPFNLVDVPWHEVDDRRFP